MRVARDASNQPRRETTRPWVLKVGGRLLEDESARKRLAQACAGAGRPVVIVHGGGCMVTELQRAFGIEAKFHEGRRITEPEHVGLVEMALSGAANKSLVRALAHAGLQPVGVSGCDGATVQAERVPELGAVGVPRSVDPSLLQHLIAGGFTPVLSPISLDPEGQAVNINADEVACAVAVAMRAERLLLLSDVSAVHVEGIPRAEIFDRDVEQLVVSGEAHGGMVPKLRAAAAATAQGVDEVCIGGLHVASLDELGGTCVRAQRLATDG
jgi:acetylglutamate kinase